MGNYQGFNSFEEMMAERRDHYSGVRTIYDVKSDVESILTQMNFERTKYNAMYAEYTNPEGCAVRLYSKGGMYEIYLPDKKKHSQGSINDLLKKLEEKIQKKKEE